MRRLFLVPVLLLAAESVDDVRKEIIACYQKSIEALRNGDVNAAALCDTDDWISITLDEKPVTRKENDQRIRQYIDNMKPPPGWTAIWQPDYEHSGTLTGVQVYDLKLQGNEAVALCLVGHSRRQTVDGAPHTVWQGSHVRDTWTKTSAGWKRRKHEKKTVNERMVDGRPIQP